MTEDDKAICKMVAHYLERAIDAIQELSPDGAHSLAIVIADHELPHTSSQNPKSPPIFPISTIFPIFPITPKDFHPTFTPHRLFCSCAR